MKVDIHNQTVLVLGIGMSGMAVVQWLLAQGAVVRAADTNAYNENLKTIRENHPAVEVIAGDFEPSLFEGVSLAVVSPGISTKEAVIVGAEASGVQVIGDIELFAQFKPEGAKVIGITGANGKTTVTTLVGEICKAAGLKTIVAGNIGLPVMQALTEETPDVYVLELSSFQLETTHSLQLDAATMLNLTQDHMDRYEDLQSYAVAKARIFYNAAVQVLNRDDAWSQLMARPQLKQASFGLEPTTEAHAYGLMEKDSGLWICKGGQALMHINDLKVVGMHNVANVMAAMALCQAIGIEQSAILQTVYNFEGLPHRMQWVLQHDDVDYYNDSKATNIGATVAAIEGLTQPLVLIAGGEGKEQDFSPLAKQIEHLRALVLIGADAPLIENNLLSTGIAMYQAIDMAEAVNISKKIAKRGDAVLLSPACASFDMFDNYQQRGEVFIAAVQAMTKQTQGGVA